MRGDVIQSQFSAAAGQVLLAVVVVCACSNLVRFVSQGRQCGGLCEGIQVERLANLFQGGDKIRVTDAVSHAQTGQSVDFGKGPHQNQVG